MKGPPRSTNVVLNVRLIGQTEVRQAILSLDAKTRKRINQQISRSAAAIQAAAQQRAPSDTGWLRASIHREPNSNFFGYRGERVLADADYAAWVEFGAWHKDRKVSQIRGNKVPAFGAGSGLAAWAARQGLPPAAIALAQARGGGPAKRPFMIPSVDEERPKFYGAISRIVFHDVPNEVGRTALRRGRTI